MYLMHGNRETQGLIQSIFISISYLKYRMLLFTYYGSVVLRETEGFERLQLRQNNTGVK